MATKKDSVGRYRNFACMVYPTEEYIKKNFPNCKYNGAQGWGSSPDNWFNIVMDWCVPCFISPLHVDDVSEDGTPKKPHFHLMLMFDGVKTVEQVTKLFDQVGGVGCKVLSSLRGYARYLCHLDNPEKAQYRTDEVRQYFGADYIKVIELASDKLLAIDEMQDFCDAYDVDSFYLLCNYCKKYRPDWHRVLKESSTLYMKEWLQSRYWSKHNDLLHIVDKDGTILV